MRLVLQTVNNAVLGQREHRSSSHLLESLVAEQGVDCLVSGLDVLLVTDDIKEHLCRLNIEEGTLSFLTVLDAGIFDSFTDGDA